MEESNNDTTDESTPKMQVISHTIKLHPETYTQQQSNYNNQTEMHAIKSEEEYNKYVEHIKAAGYNVNVKVSAYNWKGFITSILSWNEYLNMTYYLRKEDPDIIKIRQENNTTPMGCAYSINEVTIL